MFSAPSLSLNPARGQTGVPGNDARHVHVGPQYTKDVYRIRVVGQANTNNSVNLRFPHVEFPPNSYMVAVEGLLYAYRGITSTPLVPGRAPAIAVVNLDRLTAPVMLPPSNQTEQVRVTLESSPSQPGDRDHVFVLEAADREYRAVTYYPKDCPKLTTLGHVVPHPGLTFNFNWAVEFNHPGATLGNELTLDLVFYPNPLYHAT